ncbi:MAG: cation diffusion facilitator family transporter [Acidobacteriota bacterium]
MTARVDVTRKHVHHQELQDGNGPRRAMLIALALISGFIVVEVVGGILANSLALLADAGHMVSDAAALGLSVFAMWMATRPHTVRRTFGFHRAEILAGLVNGSGLVIIAFAVIWHAAERLREPPEIASGPMLAVATGGLVVNLVAMRILGDHHQHNLNVRGAFLHVLSDTLASVGVILAAAVIAVTGWTSVDGLVSIFISALILVAGLRLVRETVSVLLESSPRHLDTERLHADLEAVPGIREVHDLHVWTVTSGFVSLSCHAALAADSVADDVLRQATAMLRERYNIRHATIQPEKSVIHEASGSCCLDEHRPSANRRA